ncbi:MAG: hypothetical protein HKM06_02070 [Spirochaetales bacterium]|nr:hypothetical protein [Spirochaetales bacterium]
MEPSVPPARLGGFATVHGYKIFVWIDTGAYWSYYYHTRKTEHLLQVLGPPLSKSVREENFPYFPNNPQHVPLYDFPVLQLDQWSLRPFYLVDVSGYVDFSKGGEPTEGLVLGTQAFQNRWLLWDAKKRTLTLFPRGKRPNLDPNWSRLPAVVTEKGGRLFLRAEQDRRPFWLFLDTGNPSTFPYVARTGTKEWLVESGTNSYRHAFGAVRAGQDFDWAGVRFQHPLVLNNSQMPLGNAQVGFPWVSRFDWAVYYSDNVQFWARVPRGEAQAVDSTFPFILNVHKKSGWRLLVTAVFTDMDGTSKVPLPALGSEVTRLNGVPVAASDWPWVDSTLRYDKQVALSWKDHGKEQTETFTRSVR